MVITVFNETYKGLLLLWNYRFNLAIEIFLYGFGFIGINFFAGDGVLDETRLSSSLIGYIIFLYTFKVVSNMGWSLREEIQTGTLEQVYMSPVPFGVLLLGRLAANLLATSVTIVVLLVTLVPLLQLDVPLLNLDVLIAFIWTLVGLAGIGFVVGGVTLLFKHVDSFIDLIQYALLFCNGWLVPIERFPPLIRELARLIPGTQGIVVLRQLTFEGKSLADVWANGSFIYLLVHSLMWFALGFIFFRWCEGIAKRQGTLGRY